MNGLNRRSLITGLISLVAAPAIVRAGSLMPVKQMEDWREGFTPISLFRHREEAIARMQKRHLARAVPYIFRDYAGGFTLLWDAE